MVEIFDDLSDTLCQVADLAEFIRIAHPQSKYSMAAEDAAVAITSLVEKLNTNKSLYDALKAVVEEGDSVPTDEVDNHVAKLFLVDFEQSGIHLDKNKRKKIVELNDFALHLGSSFMHYCHVPRSVPKNKLPQNMHNMFTTEGQNVIISSLYSDSPLETVREAAYRIYLYPDSHQEELLHRLLSTRQELAELCGFPSFSHRALRGSLAEKPSTVMAFLNKLADEVRAPAQVNFDALAGVKKLKNPQSQDLKPWDIAYFSALLKNNKFRVNVNELSPFFSLGACMDGLNYLFGELYNIQLKVEEPHFGETWSPDVYKLAVVHEKEGLLGYLYCDFFEREKKPNQDCHFTIRGGRQLADGTYQLPVVVLLLNFPQPSWSVPSLLTPGMVENLFHEMGHAMHSMLARTKYQHVTGTRCSTDFAEVPSVLMEYFATDPRVLQQFARHYSTGQAISQQMLSTLCKSKHIFNGCDTQLQVFYSALDQSYHNGPMRSQTTTDTLMEVQNKYYGMTHVANTAWQLRFSHLVGYGARYYSYLMSRAVASLMWQNCFEADPFNGSMGEKYRHEVLGHGGGKPAKDLVTGFLGSSVTPEALATALIAEINQRQRSR